MNLRSKSTIRLSTTLLALFPLLSLIGTITVFIEIVSFLISLFGLFLALTRKPCKLGDCVLASYSCIVSMYFCLTQENPGTALLPCFISAVLCIGMIEESFQKEWILAPTGSLLVLLFFGFPKYQPVINYALLYILFFASIKFLAQIFSAKVSITLLNLSLYLFAIVNSWYRTTRFGHITISDVRAIRTFFEVAGNYKFKISNEVIGYGLIFVFVECVFLIPKYREQVKKLVYAGIYLMVMICTFLCMGKKASVSWNTENAELYSFESIPMSIVQEYELHTAKVDLSAQKEKKSKFESDTDSLNVNIVCVLCESYADVLNTLEIKAEKDPLQRFIALDKPNIKKGTVTIGVFGGGTSSSEWEVLTGLSLCRLPRGLTPMTSYMDNNYAFTADKLYDDYEKSIIHPYYGYGWNRDAVYTTLNYENKIFIENWGEIKEEDKFRGFVPDYQMYQKVIEQLESSEKPQFVHALTVQNHGGYDDKFQIRDSIAVNNPIVSKEDAFEQMDSEKEKNVARQLSTYFTCIDHSTDDLMDFLSYLDNHPEERTLVVFYGDHWPGDLNIKYQDVCKETPYLVYSNFGTIKDIPEQLDLSLLYPYAKWAAGLPLSSWEKYLLSLNGEPADKEMTEARILNGYF